MNISKLLVGTSGCESRFKKYNFTPKLLGIKEEAEKILQSTASYTDSFGRCVKKNDTASIINRKNGGKIVEVKNSGKACFDEKGLVIYEKTNDGDEYIYCANGNIIHIQRGEGETKTSAECFTPKYSKGIEISTIAQKDGKKITLATTTDGKEKVFVDIPGKDARELTGVGDLLDETMNEVTLKRYSDFLSYSPNVLRGIMKGNL